MSAPCIAPYGSWKSPISADLIASATIGIGQVVLDRDDVYWTELRPNEGGRSVIVRRTSDGQVVDVTPPAFNARTRVHEYGGGAFAAADRVVYFSHFGDHRVYRQDLGLEPRPITPPGSFRYADFAVDARRNRVVCVREDHSKQGREPVNALVSIDAGGDAPPNVLVSGADFYSNPRLSPGGQQLAWLSWNHPNMPWDGSELWLGRLDDRGTVFDAQRIAGGIDESIFQPEWSPDGVLHFVSDRSGWWNLYRWRGVAEPLCEMEAEFGVPQWVFGQSTYAFEPAGSILCAYGIRGTWRLAALDTKTRTASRSSPSTQSAHRAATPCSSAARAMLLPALRRSTSGIIRCGCCTAPAG
jgi:hypothetical protein